MRQESNIHVDTGGLVAGEWSETGIPHWSIESQLELCVKKDSANIWAFVFDANINQQLLLFIVNSYEYSFSNTFCTG